MTDDLDATRCPDCGGSGQVARSERQKDYTTPILWTEECEACHATGWCGPDAEKAAAQEATA